MKSRIAAALFASALATPLAAGAFSFDAPVKGDDGPVTPLVLSTGSHALTASTTAAGDLEYFTVAVPEPITLALCGLGLAGLGLAGRRRGV